MDNKISLLKEANILLRNGLYAEAIQLYENYLDNNQELKSTVKFNLDFSRIKLQKSSNTATQKKPLVSKCVKNILFISHDASLTGAPAVLSEVIGWLKSSTSIKAKIIFGGNYIDRAEEFMSLAECLHVPEINAGTQSMIENFVDNDTSLVYVNTVASGRLLQCVFNVFGDKFEYIAHLHEKEGVLNHFYSETRYITNLCKKIIVVSDDIECALRKRGASRDLNIVTIPPFIKRDLIEYHVDADLNEVPVVYGCGTIESRKGFDIFCETMSKLNREMPLKFRAVWIGKSSNDDEPFLSLSKYSAINIVETIGLHRNPRSLYRKGDIFFMSSREDPFPLVCLEAAERGLPILCFDERCGSMASFVKLSKGGLVANYLDTDDAVHCLKQLIENKEMRLSMGRNAKNYLLLHHVTTAVMPKISDFVFENFQKNRKRILKLLVISFGPAPIKNMKAVEGGGLRSWGLANGIANASAELKVKLTFPSWYLTQETEIPIESNNLSIKTWANEDELLSQVDQTDVVIVSYCYGSYSEKILGRIKGHQKLILDCYVPIHPEVCARRSQDKIGEFIAYENDSKSWINILTNGDLILCASEEQKNYYFGLMFGIGHINPINYDRSDNFIVAPFGIFAPPPPSTKQRPISKLLKNKNEVKILWFGGIYPWFDIKKIIFAIRDIRTRVPCSLTIVGARNPFNNHPDFSKISQEIEILASQLEYSDFLHLEDWVAYDDRLDWYYDADLIVSLNQPGIENRFSWRTRILDYLWAERPFATNGGDPISDLLIDSGLGYKLSIESDEILISDLERTIKQVLNLNSGGGINNEKLFDLKRTLSWDYIGTSIVDKLFDSMKKN